MIFNCPECEKKYVLSSSALGDDGKVVRCVNCAHEWFQEPTQDPYISEPEAEEEDISDDEMFDDEAIEERLGHFFDDDDESDDFEQRAEIEEDDDDYQAMPAQEKPLEEIIREISENASGQESEELVNDITDEVEMAIPKGVKPIQDDADAQGVQIGDDAKNAASIKVKSKKTKNPKKQKPPKVNKVRAEEPMMARLLGFAAAIVLFLLLFIVAIITKPQIISAWPPSAAIYELAGFSVSPDGEGLVLETLTAELSEDKKTLTLKGSIVNLRETTVKVPPMKASFKITEEDPSNMWVITPPQNEIEAGDSMEFVATYDSPPEDISMVNISFEKQF